MDSQDEELSRNVLETRIITRTATNTPRMPPEDLAKKTTFRPPTLLRTSPNLLAAAAREATNQDIAIKYRNFNDLWIRLENGGHSYIRYCVFLLFFVFLTLNFIIIIICM